MSHNTQILKRDADIETILNTGRTNDGKIYIDIRVYKTGDVIDAGELILTQKEWNEINENLNMVEKGQKLFICPECGDIVTEDEILESLTSGGFGMCLCQFGNGQRTLVRYEPHVLKVLEPTITPGEIELLKIIRRLCNEE